MRWVGPKGNTTDYTFQQLEEQSNRAANALAGLGLRAGDVLFTFLPKRPEQYFVFLGGLKLQLVVGALFSSFGDSALLDRLGPSRARALVTQKSLLHKVLRVRHQLPELEFLLVLDDPSGQPSTIDLKELFAQASPDFCAPLTPPNVPSVLHYTSGSTGKPKGALHVHGSVLLQHQTARDVLGLRDDDLYWCTADHAWVTGTSYGIIGPWSLGVTQLHCGGTYDARRWLGLLRDHAVSVWYTAPTALRMLMSEPLELFADPRPQLRSIFSVGEPLPPETLLWARRAFRQDIYDTWFQTETGAIMICNRPGMPIRPGSMGKGIAGIEPHVVDEHGRPVSEDGCGNLCLTPGWNSMFVSYVGAQAAYEAKFQHGLYWTGDLARRDADGYYWFIGRTDDVINSAGHLVSPFEVESALLERQEVADVAVVGLPDDLLFEKVAACVVLRPEFLPTPELELDLKIFVSNRVSTTASPRVVVFKDALPRNRSGKIMRRVLRARLLGQDPGDLSTLEGEGDDSPRPQRAMEDQA